MRPTPDTQTETDRPEFGFDRAGVEARQRAVEEALAADPDYQKTIETLGSILSELPGRLQPELALAVQVGILEARRLIVAAFETNPQPLNNLEFHRWSHTAGVIERSALILKTIAAAIKDYDRRSSLITRTDVAKAAFWAAYHDAVQGWRPVTRAESQAQIRQRDIGDNEQSSYILLAAAMNKANDLRPADRPIFTKADFGLAQQAFDATVPGWDPATKTVNQPKRPTANVSFVVEAIALADLATAGMEGPERYLAEGDALFREENLDIAAALSDRPALSARSGPDSALAAVSPELQAKFRARMLAWSTSQVSFAQGRQARFETETRPLLNQLEGQGVDPQPVQLALRSLFGQFKDTITAAQAQAEARQSLGFWALAQAMGYPIPDSLLALDQSEALPKPA